MCLGPLKRHWTMILVKGWSEMSLMEQPWKVPNHPGNGLGLLHILDYGHITREHPFEQECLLFDIIWHLRDCQEKVELSQSLD
jgi:hypothetical protein